MEDSASSNPMKDDGDSETISWLAIPMFKLGMVIREVCGKELGEKLVDNIDEWLEPELHAAFEAERSKAALDAQTNAVAWTIGVVDDLHMQTDEYQRDRTYKGVKNTLRDRYKAEIGIDPAPSYPVKAELKQGPNHAK